MSGKTNVLRWAKAGGPPPAAEDPPPSPKATEAIGMLSDSGEPGRVHVPFPVGSSSSYSGVPSAELQRKIREAKIERVPLERISTNGQRSVAAKGVARYFDSPRAKAKSHGGDHPVDKPIVVRSAGQLTAYDGHHRLTASVLKGETHVDARVVDLDKPS